jgi:hypothetical protein
MKLINSVNEFFSSQEKESERLCKELEEHMAEWLEVKRQYESEDQKAIETAHQLGAARLAGSPTALSIEADLILLRRKRDGIKHVFQLRRDALHHEIETYSREPIREFSEFAIDSLHGLSQLYSAERVEGMRDLVSGRKIRESVSIRHNARALDACRDRILELRKAAEGMLHRPLAEINNFIRDAKAEIERFPVTTMEICEVSEDKARDMLHPANEPSDIRESVYQFGLGMPNVITHKDTGKLGQLADRITKLEKGS